MDYEIAKMWNPSANIFVLKNKKLNTNNLMMF